MEANANEKLITDDVIAKALSTLGISLEGEVQTEEPILEKAEPKAQMPENEPTEKEEGEEEEKDEYSEDEYSKMEKAYGKAKSKLEKMSGDMEAYKSKMPKPEVTGEPEIKKSEGNDIGTETADLLKGMLNEFQSNVEKSNADLINRLESIEKSNTELRSELDYIANQPNQPKSFTKASVIEKADVNGTIQTGTDTTSYSLTTNRNEISNTLSTLSDGNVNYENAVIVFESAGHIEKSIQDDLRLNHKIVITE